MISTSAMTCCEESGSVEELELSVLRARKSVNLRRRDSCGAIVDLKVKQILRNLGQKPLRSYLIDLK